MTELKTPRMQQTSVLEKTSQNMLSNNETTKKPKARTVSLPRWVRSAITLIVLVAFWWLITTFWLDHPRVYPAPYDVLEAFSRIVTGSTPLGSTWEHLSATLQRALIAFGVAYAMGTLFGILAGRKPAFYAAMRPIVWTAFAVPSVAWVFIFLLVFGISNIVPIMALVVLLASPVFLGAAEGTKAIRKDLLEMADVYRVRGIDRLLSIYIPSITPYMLANARISFSLAIRIVIVAEIVGLPDGVGFLVRYWNDQVHMAEVVAWGIVLMLIGMLVDKYIIGYFENKTAYWAKPNSK